MPSLDKILAMDAQYRREYPKTYKAKDMLLKGHLTAKEFDQVAKGEAMEKHIDNNPEMVGEKKSIILTDAPAPPKSDTDILIGQADRYIEEGIKTWVPIQIDHVVIRAARREEVDTCDPSVIHIQIGFKLFNVQEQTMQELATDVTVEREVMKMEASQATQYWIMFNQCLVNQLTQIVLQLIHGIKSGKF